MQMIYMVMRRLSFFQQANSNGLILKTLIQIKILKKNMFHYEKAKIKTKIKNRVLKSYQSQ